MIYLALHLLILLPLALIARHILADFRSAAPVNAAARNSDNALIYNHYSGYLQKNQKPRRVKRTIKTGLTMSPPGVLPPTPPPAFVLFVRRPSPLIRSAPHG
jgi:hypothetical protein